MSSLSVFLLLLFCFSRKSLGAASTLTNQNNSVIGDTIDANKWITFASTVVSLGGNFEMGFFAPGNNSNYYIGIWYKKLSVQTVIWVANRETPISIYEMDFAQFKIVDGNLVVLNGTTRTLWSTNINNSTNSNNSQVVATLFDDGNLILSNGDSKNSTNFLWTSFDHPSHTVMPGSKFGYNKRTRLKQVLTSWKNENDPSPGPFTHEVDMDKYSGQFVIMWNHSVIYWNSGPWTGNNFTAGEHQKKTSKKLKVAIPIGVIAALLFVSCFTYIYYRKRRSSKVKESSTKSLMQNTEGEGKELINIQDEDKGNIDAPFFSLESILVATDDFSEQNKLGQGGFGPVYKGIFSGGREIAVKRLSSHSEQGINEFKNEVILIARLQHRNLVRLLGYCFQSSEKILLYEYMANKSLDTFIFDRRRCMILDWSKRFEIIEGIARGLLYLHHDSRLRIIHRDLKTSNILLDEELNPKISDFGLARVVEGKITQGNTNKVVGTYGYMAPEYAIDGLFSIKSDVFSFGIVILEIISGRRNTGFIHQEEVSTNLLGHAWRLWKEDKAMDLVDQSLHESCNEEEAIKYLNIGLLCVQEDPKDRPNTSNIVMMLGSENIISLPSPNQPSFMTRKYANNNTSSSSAAKSNIVSNNELTVTIEVGR
ncbi:G-type lectin S-receptor-like serine/threonine-protein kinase At4g03230 isoform X3 [Lycium barbarum]|uniref:G-type lectin S-receptor-like serine/threonine-protein kinase At4g03230 isoform X3 n=1 Tax=Lycium barbarum TaxID=112863 RepID=UPI00293E4692|nr:G-type lectin S-receptor-like serine/threonine-protein kinase At4g03230 isoform X3 [Lycium barbarum]